MKAIDNFLTKVNTKLSKYIGKIGTVDSIMASYIDTIVSLDVVAEKSVSAVVEYEQQIRALGKKQSDAHVELEKAKRFAANLRKVLEV